MSRIKILITFHFATVIFEICLSFDGQIFTVTDLVGKRCPLFEPTEYFP